MADPLSVTSGVLTLVLFSLQSSKLLYETVASFRNNQRNIRELKEELEALNEILKSLHETVVNTDTDLTALNLPLLRCGKACRDFEEVIVKCTAHSSGPKTSFRDWAKLKYMGDDIVGFKNMIAGYKATITIALGDANLRTTVVTVSVLKEYKEMITNTTADLQEHLQEIDSKLRALSTHGTAISDDNTTERQQMLEERDSTQQCLGICAEVLTHIDEVQPKIAPSTATPPAAQQGSLALLRGIPSARIATTDAFNICKETLSTTATQLEARLQDINTRLQTSHSVPAIASDEQTAEQNRIKEEIDSVKQCLTICAQASALADRERINIFEDIYMSDDSQQVLVSTIGDLVSAKRITAGARSTQWMGQMSDESLQQISRDRSQTGIVNVLEPQTGQGGQFENRYGAGMKLSSLNLKDEGPVDK